MGLNQALDISVSGIEAERRTMELISSNLANINTTRSIYGGPYRRKMPVLSEVPMSSFADELARAEDKLAVTGGGVEVVDVVEDMTPFQTVYNPGHPDANAMGYVDMPNVNMSNEMVDMIYTSKVYEANITAFNATKKMMTDTLQLP
ncbi:MAG: flagellar basal body rod protein FlgC [Candidatus Margulisbacteria bacterium]|nr:flagellar basal body rod protein FlgC [Candidatus Margulisiibacteriota bacterium]